MTEFYKCFEHERKWYEDRITPIYFVSFYIEEYKFNEIVEWSKKALIGTCRIERLDLECTSINNKIFHHVKFRLSNENDILTMKLTWG